MAHWMHSAPLPQVVAPEPAEEESTIPAALRGPATPQARRVDDPMPTDTEVTEVDERGAWIPPALRGANS